MDNLRSHHVPLAEDRDDDVWEDAVGDLPEVVVQGGGYLEEIAVELRAVGDNRENENAEAAAGGQQLEEAEAQNEPEAAGEQHVEAAAALNELLKELQAPEIMEMSDLCKYLQIITLMTFCTVRAINISPNISCFCSCFSSPAHPIRSLLLGRASLCSLGLENATRLVFFNYFLFKEVDFKGRCVLPTLYIKL